jgi:hypothetical protein
MIGQYLPNNNEKCYSVILPKISDLNRPYVCGGGTVHIHTYMQASDGPYSILYVLHEGRVLRILQFYFSPLLLFATTCSVLIYLVYSQLQRKCINSCCVVEY